MSSSIRVSSLARREMASVMAALGSGGSLAINGGLQPSDCEQDSVDGNELVRLALGKLTELGDGRVQGVGSFQGEVERGGSPTWFRVRSRKGEALWDGSVGMSGADLIIKNNYGATKLYLFKGSVFKLETIVFAVNHRGV